jgi:tight adherence protein C
VIILLLLGVVFAGAFAALVARLVALPRLRAIERIDQIAAYGFSAEPTAPESPRALTNAFNALARSVGTFFGRRRPMSQSTLQRELVAAGLYGISPVTIVGYRVLCAFALPSLFLWTASNAGLTGGTGVMGTLVMLGLGWMAPLTIVRRRARHRLECIDYELPELVDLLVVTVESGLGFAGSMQVAAQRFSGPLGDELRLALQEQAMGLSNDQALANLLARTDTDGMRSFVRSVRQGESLGVSIGQIMRNLADEMRKRRQAAAEERAQKAPIKILFPLVGLIFPAIFVVILVPAILAFTATLGGGS